MVEGDIDEARAGARSLYMTHTTPLGRTVVGSAVSGLVSERGVDGRRPTALVLFKRTRTGKGLSWGLNVGLVFNAALNIVQLFPPGGAFFISPWVWGPGPPQTENKNRPFSDRYIAVTCVITC